MCGIAGFYNPKIDFSDNPKKTLQILTNMIRSMRMRGPNDSGYTIIRSCCFAHSRLSIIDVENGKQPFTITYNEQKFHIIFNGEIYNHRELRNDLKSLGYHFSTNSDTEVIGYAYIHYGADFVEKLLGIFAIAIYDEAYERLYLFRDHFGIKPLYYTVMQNTVVFASRIDTLFEYPGVKPSIDKNGLNEIFALGPAKTYGSGVFSNILEVKPGEYLSISKQGIHKTTYYRLISRPHEDSYEDTILKTRELLVDSIKRQMISDVDICTFLSGGIDSSLVSSICASELRKNDPSADPLKTYSFDFVDNNLHFQKNSFQPTEDLPYVKEMITYLGSDHTFLYCSYDTLADLLEESVLSRCLPTMADIDASLLYFCGEVAKNHKVALTGECADEIFGGYPWFHRKEMLESNTFPWMPDLKFRKSLLNPEFAASLHMDEYVANAYENTLSEINLLPHESIVEQNRRKISFLNIRWFMQTLLDRMDRTSMHHGLEARVPFADPRLIDYVFNVPWKYKCPNGIPKNLLREAAKPYLPESIFTRPKNPYPKTYHPKYEELLCKRLTAILHDSASPIRSYVNVPAVLQFLESPKEYGKPWYGQLMAGPQMVAYLLQVNFWLSNYHISY